jgi:UDP-glucose 4-epimerase
MGEHMLKAFEDSHGLDWVALRYFNVVGAGQDSLGAYTGVVTRTFKRILNGDPPLIFGTGGQTYDFIHAGDVARANVMAATSRVSRDVFNVCTGTGTSIKDLIDMILEVTWSKLKPEYPEGGVGYVTDRIGDPRKAKRELGFVAKANLVDILRGMAISYGFCQRASRED